MWNRTAREAKPATASVLLNEKHPHEASRSAGLGGAETTLVLFLFMIFLGDGLNFLCFQII